jgi:hypothetical protein
LKQKRDENVVTSVSSGSPNGNTLAGLSSTAIRRRFSSVGSLRHSLVSQEINVKGLRPRNTELQHRVKEVGGFAEDKRKIRLKTRKRFSGGKLTY